MSKKEEDEEGKEGSSRRISWIRRRDFHVLTSSTFTYTNDERFQVLHAEGSDDWTLQIKYVQERDNGTYECQGKVSRDALSRVSKRVKERKRDREVRKAGDTQRIKVKRKSNCTES
uniref:Ig-like domain-containing protein n=1 Tax=Vespula pensylvanica TaxID=30213 RepID=A0A834PCE7_VESPE|nr:hypothetical protein H0235_003712 [Vespula pensylvanica]